MPDPNDPFILIVDDNANNLSLLSEILKSAGYKVRMAMDGEAALNQVKRAHPELILLDIQMPKIDGFETCRQLQSNPATAGIPVIFMTALTDADNKVKGLTLGAVDYMTKPLEATEVLARVKIHWRLKQFTDRLEQQVIERTDALQQAQIQLIQKEKLSALGELVAGIAHELNNPIACVSGNVEEVENNVQDLLNLIDLCRKHIPQPNAEVDAAIEEIDLEYLREDVPKLIQSMKNASDRIVSISKSLRTFSRSDIDTKQAFNLHEAIDSTLLILNHRLKQNEQRPAIQVVKNHGQIPLLQCFPGQLNQVFMNILANAIDALDESNSGRSFDDIESNPNRITILTVVEDNQIKIAIADNAKGMTPEVKARVFDSLFTTKGVGKGTGLGLAIARQIVVEKHGGSLEVQSGLDQGTQFCIRLPMDVS
jgi:signal transduction histidine kinase